MGTQKLKKVPMGTGSLKWGPTWEQWRYARDFPLMPVYTGARNFNGTWAHCNTVTVYLASSSDIEGVALPSVSVRDLLGSVTASMDRSLAAATTSGNVNVAAEEEGAITGERASLAEDSGGSENEEGPKGGK